MSDCSNVWTLAIFSIFTEKGIWATALTIYEADPNLGNFNFTQEPNDL